MMIRGDSGAGPALPELHKRLRWAALVVLIAFCLLFGRLWQLQLIRGDSYYDRTVSNVIKEQTLPAVRGKIVDRNGVPLADNRPAFNIYATPKVVTDTTVAELERLLGLSEDELANIKTRLAAGKRRAPGLPVLILEDQGRDRAALVDQGGPRLPGLEVKYEPYRWYPQGDMAAHLIGYMTQLHAEEVEKLAGSGYDPNDLIGRDGLEAGLENHLRGKAGTEKYAVDARGQRLDDVTAEALIKGERIERPVPGANVILTLDADLQRLAERTISRSMAAAIVVVEPKTGKIRALVSKPSYDPNVMTGHLTHAEYQLLKQDPRLPFIDKALRATYPPGSIFKFTTALAALEDGQAAEDENMFCTGEYQLSGTRFRCHGTHGKINLLSAIQHSCDVYFWKLAERIGIDRIAQVAKEYGLGVPTNIGINNESAGRIPTKAWYEDKTGYKVGFATNTAIGQGDVEVTVLQMAMAYAALANGGTLWVPQIIDRIESWEGKLLMPYPPTVAHTIHTPAEALDTWKKGMWKVTNEPGGTAFEHGHVDVVTVMGKTGTAEVKKHHRADDEKDMDGWHPNAAHAWFAGWAPAEDPEIVVVVLVEHGGPGGQVAWPIAKQVIEGYFTKVKKK
jgi:penicillin-binding protein 2